MKNKAYFSGGGIFGLKIFKFQFNNIEIYNNTAVQSGAGAYFENGCKDLEFSEILIYNNNAKKDAGGLFMGNTKGI